MTNADIQNALKIMMAATEAIRDAGSIPIGMLYAVMMSKMDLAAFESMVRQIVRTGLVKEENRVLIWIGESA